MPQVVRLRDEVYHKEEALWLARKEIRDRDEHIQIMQQEFDTMAHEFNDLQQLLIQLEAQAADAAPERKPDHAKGTLGMQKDKSDHSCIEFKPDFDAMQQASTGHAREP